MDIGIFLFLGIAGMAFWLLIFLFTVAVPYWVTQSILYKMGIMKEMPTPKIQEKSQEVKAD